MSPSNHGRQRSTRAVFGAAVRAAEATVVLTFVRLALWLLPFRYVKRVYIDETQRSSQHTLLRRNTDSDVAVSRQVARAIDRASRLVPHSSCLPRALAARRMLERRGLTSALRFGVLRTAEGLCAHAWIEVAGRTVVGALPDLDRYTPLPHMPQTLLGKRSARANAR